MKPVDKLKLSLVLAVILALPLLAGSADKTRDFEIREYDGMPCLWQNGLPYFTRFSSTNHEVLDLAGEWRFSIDPNSLGVGGGWSAFDFDDQSWDTMNVPGSWNVIGSPYDKHNGVAWYRREFTATDEQAGAGLARLYLDGVYHSGMVWLNGHLLGSHRGGYTAWSLDAGRVLRPGRNVIAVRVDNTRGYTDVPPKLWVQDRLGWWPYGGIGRLVRIELSPAVSMNKLVVEAKPLPDGRGRLGLSGLVFNRGASAAEVAVGAEFGNASTRTLILVPAGDCARFDLPPIEVDKVELWSDVNPATYPLTLTVEGPAGQERLEQEIGFRDFQILGEELFLNGKSIWLRGINRHEDDPVTGLYQTDARLDEDMALLRELRVNHMRPGHYPNDPRLLDRCDRAGITITEEIPLYQAGEGVLKWFESKFQKKREGVPWRVGGDYPTRKQMTDPELLASADQQIIEMIERDRNHPSVIMWSVGNENMTFYPSARKMYRHLIATARRFDSRPVTFAIMIGPYVSPAIEWTGDMGDVIFVNQYYGWYFGKPQGVGGFLDKMHNKYPGKPIVVSEFGAGSVPGRHADPPEKFSEDYQVYFYQEQFRQALARPYVVGTMPWVFSDFRCPWFEEEHPVYQVNLKGLVSHDRKKKAAFEFIRETYTRMEREKAAQ